MKRILSAALALGLALTCTACGSAASSAASSTAPAAGSSAAAGAANGGSYTPPDNMTMFAAYDVGGGVDVFGREVAGMLEKNGLYGSTFLYENVGGASGQVGLAAIKNQHDGDDSYLISCSSTFLNSAYESGKKDAYGYEDLTLIAQLACDYRCIVVPAASKYQTMEDLIAYGKDNEIVGAISGTGGIGHIGLEMLKSEAGVKMRNVPFDGSNDVIAAILGNQVDVAVQAVQSAVEYQEAGQMRILAVCSAERLAALPDVPTTAECGLDIVLPTSRGLAMPKNVSEDAKEYWIGQLKALSETEEFKAYCEKNSYTLEFAGGDDFYKLVDDDCKATTEMMKTLGLYGVN